MNRQVYVRAESEAECNCESVVMTTLAETDALKLFGEHNMAELSLCRIFIINRSCKLLFKASGTRFTRKICVMKIVTRIVTKIVMRFPILRKWGK